MNEIELDSVPFGDSYYVIYYLRKSDEKPKKPRIYFGVSPLQRKNGKYYQPTFREILTTIENNEKDNIAHCMIIAESGLQGVVYRYNNYGNNRIYECGTTRGYA